jgi:hypothetical protein
MTLSTESTGAGGTGSAARQFVRHYVEMLIAMFLGMAVLALPARLALPAAGTSWSELGHEAMLLGMAVEMTVPMVAWMHFRGHGPRASGEMAGAMLLPTLAAIALLRADVAGSGVLMVAEHVAMLLSMLVVMLLRPAEYAHVHGRPEAVAA